MGDRRRKNCRACRRHADDCGELSWSGLCVECGHTVLNENIDGLHEHTGPALQRWRRGMAASIGAVLVDDLRERA